MSVTESIPPPLQLRLEEVEASLPHAHPLIHLQTVRDTLGADEDRAKYLYERGLIRFAFDLSDVGSRRREIRVWRNSFLEYARAFALKDYSYKERTEAPGELNDVAADCMPKGVRVTIAALHLRWSISSTHLHDLVRAGELAIVPGQTLRQKQSPLLEPSSVLAFLKKRRIGSP